MTTSSYRMGHYFSEINLQTDFDGVDSQAIRDAIVARFNDLATEAGDPTMQWLPHTSEVYYDCRGESPNPMTPVHALTRDIEEMREQAVGEVWARVEAGDYDLADEVR